ncbi:rhodanese-like domain protein [Mycobacterium kansasii]|uniref:Rhodanese-like domain protein n=1 Tax=Mycobacterium kansasii TaxID=1768 RepID=A0A1V3WP41_MYCKA|nr:rhodanese-like domain protein [Mycobacterium kansasii]
MRPHEEYQAGHIPGAINIPVAELAGRLAELPADRDIVAYCRGAYCVMAPTQSILLAPRPRGDAARRRNARMAVGRPAGA